MSIATININETPPLATSIAPWLSVADCAKAVAFYKEAFNTTENYRLDTPDGTPLVARLSINGAEFWLGEESPENTNENILTQKNIPVRMILTVSDPDAFFAHAIKAGATQIFAVGEEHGWRMGRLADPFGNQWEIGREITKH